MLSNSCRLLIALAFFVSSCGSKNLTENPPTTDTTSTPVDAWITNADKSSLFAKQANGPRLSAAPGLTPQIVINPSQTYQSMEGFGYTLTGGSAKLLSGMQAATRASLLQELFGTAVNSIGVSYLRISIGASDLSDRVYSYNDLAAGETDPNLEKFSIEPEKAELIPILKEIIAIRPQIKILASPWSPPAWMKTNNDPKGGSLKPEYYAAYAKYFVKYVEAMKAEGITIDAITIQNEPLHPGNNPSMLMQPAEQGLFIKQNLGPAFEAAGIDTKIILYDHNADRPDYPISILNDADAKRYVDGSAFHLYAGNIEALSQVHNAHPDRHIYFTEQWVGAPSNFGGDLGWHVKNLVIGAPRNWSRNVLEWNLASDPNQDPHTDGGCENCLGALTIDGNIFGRNTAYYVIAHASKFVVPGSLRIESSELTGIPNVAFKTPAGEYVLILLNETNNTVAIGIKIGNKSFNANVKAGAVVTYVWK